MVKTIRESKTTDPSVLQFYKILNNMDIQKEIDYLFDLLSKVDSPVVFCHNDLQEGLNEMKKS